MKVNLLLIIILLFLVACQKGAVKNVKQKTISASAIKNENNTIPKFNANDSVGEFTGLIKRFVDTSADDPICHLVLLDGSGDSTEFEFSYCQVRNADKERMTSGSCVLVKYYAEILREGDVEFRRTFIITDIKYK